MKQLEPVFLALSDATRLRIINLLGNGEVAVSDLVEVLNESQPKISRHLAYLRSAGLVSVRRDGKWIYYRLEELTEPVDGIVGELLDWSAAQEEWAQERDQLDAVQTTTAKVTGRAKEKVRVKREKQERKTSPIEYETQDEVLQAETRYDEHEERATQLPPFQREEMETFLL